MNLVILILALTWGVVAIATTPQDFLIQSLGWFVAAVIWAYSRWRQRVLARQLQAAIEAAQRVSGIAQENSSLFLHYKGRFEKAEEVMEQLRRGAGPPEGEM